MTVLPKLQRIIITATTRECYDESEKGNQKIGEGGIYVIRFVYLHILWLVIVVVRNEMIDANLARSVRRADKIRHEECVIRSTF